jgi:outer membrane protein
MKVPEARSHWLPAVKATATDIHGHVSQENSIFPNYETRGYTVGLSQTVFDWGALQDVRESDEIVAQARLMYAESRSNLILRVCSAYFNAMNAQEELQVASRHIDALIAQEQVVEKNFQYGNGTIVDVRDAQANLDSARADRVGFENDLDVKLAQLSSIVGHRPKSLASLRRNVALSIVPRTDVADWMVRAAEQNFDVRIQEFEIARARTEISRARYSNLPTITAIASYGRGNANYINGQDNFITGGNAAGVAEVGLQITIPLFDGMLSRNQMREHLALEEKAQDDLEAAKQNASLGAQQAYLSVQGGKARIEALRVARASAQESLNYNSKGYQAGLRLNSDVLAAADKLYTQDKQLLEATVTILNWSLRLKDVAGELSVADIDAIDAMLAP